MDSATLVAAGVVVAVVLVARIVRRRKREAEMLDRIPGPATLPLVGNLFDVAVRRDQVVKRLMKRRQDHGTIYRIWLGPIPIVHISKPKYIEVILSSSKHTLKGNFYRFLYPWLGTGLLTSSGKKWFDHRKLITPTFHFKILEGFVEVFAEHSRILVQKLREKAATGESLDVFPLVTLCALDIICETAMGIQLKSQSDDKSTYVASLNKISELTTERSNKLWLHPNIVFFNTSKGAEYNEHLKVLHAFTEKVIRERKQERIRRQQMQTHPPASGRKAFLDLLLEASERSDNQHLTERDIREEVDTFMFEGHDTTTAAICWTLYSLGRNPEIQEELWQEQKTIFGADGSTPPSMRDLWEMKLLDRVIKESLRLYPSVSFISRKLEEEVVLGKYTIPADTTICIDIINVHRNPTFFPDPEKFDPDRWLPENSQNRHPYCYIPFSAGPRNCIGQKFALLEEKVVLSFLVRNFRVEALQQPKQLTLTNELILRPLEGILLRVTKRLDFFSLLLGVLVFVFFWKMSRSRGNGSMNKMPGPLAYPIVGNIFEMLEPRHKVLENVVDRRKKFGSLFLVWMGPNPVIISSSPNDIELLLKSSKHSQKASSYDFLHAWLGNGLLTSYGRQWATHRKLITPTFHFKVLQSFIDTFQECANVLVEKLKPKAETGEAIDIYTYATLCTLDIICETAMGTKVNAQGESRSQYVQSVYKLSELVVRRMRCIWLFPSFIFERSPTGKEFRKHLEVVHGFSNSVIRRRKEALKKERRENDDEENGKKMNFLDLLLLESSGEEGTPLLTDEEIREEVDTFMFEGHDTTSAAISWALALLGSNQDVQEDCYQELKAIFEDDPNRTPTLSDLAEMKLLERVIKEALRLYPSVSSIARVLEEDVQFGEYLVPKGTDVIISIYALHTDPEHYPDPHRFDPDRFLPENIQKRHPYSYLPFSAGPRNCIGQKFAMHEEKIVLSTLIRNFRFHSLEDPEAIKKTPDLVLKPQSGIRMTISKRV